MAAQRLFFSLFILASCLAFAQEPYSAVLIEKIAQNQDVCVKHVCEERIYLQEDCLLPTAQGLFLTLNHREYIKIPLLFPMRRAVTSKQQITRQI